MASTLVSVNKSVQHREGLYVPAKIKSIQTRTDTAVPEVGYSETQV